MFTIRNLLVAICSLLCLNAKSQLEYYKWYFGNQAGINFTTNPPTPITTGNAMNCVDNSGIISDSLGNVLFYSNGMTVWNKNNAIMQNGTGLLGQSSGGHSATIVRKPGSSTIYYLFTMDYFGASNGLRYSIIDMSLNGGLGGVTAQKNVALLTPASEQIIPVVHSNGVDIWIIAHDWGNAVYKAFLLTSSGISSTPVTSTAGTARLTSGSILNQQYGAQGQISVNAANNKLATAISGADAWDLLDFDNSTGGISHARTFTGYEYAWGVEFSADGSKVYLTGLNQTYLYQFDITSNNTATIAASAVNVGPITGPSGAYIAGYMQRAPDNKIYIAVYDDTNLAVINNPDLAGTACNVVDAGFNLGGKISSAGLVDKILVTRECIRDSSILGSDTSLCIGQSITLTAPSGASYRWSNDSTTPSLTVSIAGNYRVTVTEFGSCTITDAINVGFVFQPASINLGSDRLFCGPVVLTLNAGQSAQWSTGVNASQINVTQPGVYWAVASNSCGTRRDSIVITQGVTPVVNLGNDTSQCGNQPFTLNVAQANATYNWSTGASSSSISATTSGIYSVTVTDVSGCSATDTINLDLSSTLIGNFQITPPSCGINNGAIICTNINGVSPISVQWNLNGSNIGNTYQVSNLGAGTYYFNATDAVGCTIDTSFILNNTTGPGSLTVNSTDDTICSGTLVSICAPIGYAAYQWNNGATTQCIDTRFAGNYYVTVTDVGNCTASSAALTVFAYPLPSVSVTVNGDTMTAYNGTYYQWYYEGEPIEGATDNVHIATQNGVYNVVVSDRNGCAASSNDIGMIGTGLEVLAGSNFTVYPNPSALQGWFIEVDNEMLGSVVEVYDYSSRLMYTKVIEQERSEISFDAAKGVYILRLVNGSNIVSRKLIKL